jgi:NADH-quinone oxidoreductase subunit K
VFALFVIVLAAAEIGVGLAVILRFFRLRGTVHTDHVGAADDISPDGADDGGAAGEVRR